MISVSPDIGWVTLPHLNPSIATVSIGHTDSETFYLPVRHYRPFLTRAIGVSEQVCSSFVNDCNLDPDSVDFIPYGVERREEKPPENEEDMLKLVYVGRLEEEQKRVSDIVAIAKRLSDAGVDYRLSIVGDGEEMPMMRQELSNETANGKVVFHGWLDGDAVRAELCSSDVFLLTSAYEGFCISLIEALANGCCPIVTDIRSGNSQLIESGDNGFIVPIGDVDAFVEKIRFLDRDRMALIRMREKAWETGKQYGIDGMVERYRACFEKAVEQVKIEPKNIDPEYPLMETCRSRYPMWLRKLKKRAISITK
ncbi:MAG TPA: glycosyltransferase family 4 protein [Aridibacter sp.]|nr:glycosyltransferase family 4 protein [Aridibacter sp.]